MTENALFKVLYHEDGEAEDFWEDELIQACGVYEKNPDAVKLYHSTILREGNFLKGSSETRKKKKRTTGRDGQKRKRKKAVSRENIDNQDENTCESGTEGSGHDSDTVNSSDHEKRKDAPKRKEELQVSTSKSPALSEEECYKEIMQVSPRLAQLKIARNELERQLKENIEEEQKLKARLSQLTAWLSS